MSLGHSQSPEKYLYVTKVDISNFLATNGRRVKLDKLDKRVTQYKELNNK